MIYAPIYVPFRLIGFSKYRFDNPMTIRECRSKFYRFRNFLRTKSVPRKIHCPQSGVLYGVQGKSSSGI